MHLLCRTGVFVTVLACGLFVSCRGDNGIVPSLVAVDPATVLFLDDFDNENNGVGVYNWTQFAQWNVLDGCVDLHGNGFHDVQPGKGLYVDLDGSCEKAGTIETKTEFTLTPGNYILEFWIAGNHRRSSPDTVNVTLGSVYQEEMVMQHNEPFRLRTRTINVAAQTTARLRFQNSGADWEGALLDLVRLRRAP
jgi:hypothetical protein